ncbi:NADH-quinone oxidoreductase subunit L [Candidatus Profftia sp. (ex Adelges kitamiensis)]|uniref:NADH-quinone oxidoreductase subunit L n=1 Tax=Candidatus Profftia sp. (ex Adelges kitamiensis) TaxID=2864218 RepID=UPI001CE34B7E|nr:NADH-quinone oxidoreductase subunit L [Candidatus Profftia sp. (ex Adelges kitamiensis)]
MNLLYLIILIPFMGFFLLACSSGRWLERTSSIIGVGSIGLTALVTIYVGFDFFSQQAIGMRVFNQYLWNWIAVENFIIPVTLTIDGLSLSMLSVVIGVGFLIHIFSSWYMQGSEGYSRFFAYTNLFIASMAVLVLANNLLLMYLGWEGVGLCSYLLIGFYYTNSVNGMAAIKAFIITRLGDVFFAIGLFILYRELGTLNIHELMITASQKLELNSTAITLATLMLLGGAVGKSAQLPLQTWLADAMVGPTPVSALIHAATMVTSGVYLIARTYGLFIIAPTILDIVGIIGVITMIISGFSALVQTDIKRVLAYSTMSQIGYMFLALGVQGWGSAIIHLIMHAFFKGLLFLSSGSIILACHHEKNMFKMGGLYKSLPFLYICFLIGGSSLSALPIFTAGFYSKDEILWNVLSSGHINLVIAGLFSSFLTSLYTFRMIFIVFHGKEHIKVHVNKGITHNLPLIILLVLSTYIGKLIIPPLVGVFPENHSIIVGSKLMLEIISGIISTLGVLLAAILFLGKRQFINKIANSMYGRLLSKWWFYSWGFDWLYKIFFIYIFNFIAYLLQNDPLNKLINLSVVFIKWCHCALITSVNGNLRWYMIYMSMGAVIILALLLFIK